MTTCLTENRAPETRRNEKKRARAGFTLTEVMIACSIAIVVGAGVMAVFLWSGEKFFLCSKIAWSQNEAMRSSTKIAAYIRNASKITGIDTNAGSWLQLRFPDGTVGTLVYSNAAPILRDGRLYLQSTNSTLLLVTRGLTKVMDSQGFTTPIFVQTRANAVRVAYRVSEPAATGDAAADDGDYAATVRFGACLRNVTP